VSATGITVEWRYHMSHESETESLLASSIIQFNVVSLESWLKAEGSSLFDTGYFREVNMVYDSIGQTRFSLITVLDASSDSRSIEIRIDRDAEEILVLNSEIQSGVEVRTMFGLVELCFDLETNGEFLSSTQRIEINGKAWEAPTALWRELTFPEVDIRRLEEALTPEGFEALVRFVGLLSRPGFHSPPVRDLCEIHLPGILGDACGGQETDPPWWKPSKEDACAFDASFGFPCDSRTMSLEELERIEAGELSLEEAIQAHQAVTSAVARRPEEMPYDDSLVEEAFAEILAKHQLQRFHTRAGSQDGSLSVQVTINQHVEVFSQIKAVAEAFLDTRDLYPGAAPAVLELEIGSASGEATERFRITPETALQLSNGDISIQQFYVENVKISSP
jgi:hypothetical protein